MARKAKKKVAAEPVEVGMRSDRSDSATKVVVSAPEARATAGGLAKAKQESEDPTRSYRCLANISVAGHNYGLGSVVKLTASQARPILDSLVDLDDELKQAKEAAERAQEVADRLAAEQMAAARAAD